MPEQTIDTVETLDNGCVIQHGTHNDRIYLMKVGQGHAPDLPKTLINKARECRYSKVFAKVPGSLGARFVSAGYEQEAAIPGFYLGTEDALFMSYFLTDERRRENGPEQLDEVLGIALAKRGKWDAKPLDGRFATRVCKENDAKRMAEIYAQVFPSYPFPIHDPEYLRETMRGHVDYFAIEAEGTIIALASAEKDMGSASAEMTDFATLPQWRGYGLASHLLATMEDSSRRQSIRTAYTIARAVSPGMNVTFAKHGYRYAGRLKNNTNISGRIESMNIWHRPL